MTAPRVPLYSPDNPFAKKRYSADNPFARQADFSGVQGGGSTTAADPDPATFSDLERQVVGLPPKEKHPIRDALVQTALANPYSGAAYLATRNIDPKAAAYGSSQGLSFGTADELAAGVMAPFGKGTVAENYRGRRDAMREYGHTLEKQSPGSYHLGEFSGAMAPVVATAGSGAVAPSLLRSVGRGAVQGALTGAAAGYGYAEGPQSQQLTQSAVSAGFGGVLGAAAPVVARGATGLYRALTEKAGEKAARVGGEQAIAALQRDGYTLDEAKRIVVELSNAGAGNKPAALIDLPNAENVRGAARGVHSQPGPGRQTIQGFTDARQAGNAARLQRDFTAASGTPAGSPSLEREAVLRARREADAANFGSSVDAMGDTPITDPDLLTLIEDKPSLRAARAVARRAEEERVGTSAMAAREPATTDAVTTGPAKHYPYDSVRRPNGDARPVSDLPKVSDDGLFRELSDLMDKQSEGQRRAQYRSTFDDDMQLQRTVATRKGGGPSEQAKALRNLDDWQNRQDAIETELRRRGHTDDSIADAMLTDPEARAEMLAERAAIQSEGAGTGAQGTTARELQRMKQALDKAIVAGKLENPFAPGAQHSDAQALGQTRAQLVERMNANIPGYQAANQSSAEALGKAKAITLGARLFNKSPDAVGEAYRGLRSDAERAAFRRAYGQKYLEAIGGGRGGSDRAGAVFGTTGTLPGSETKLAQARAAFEDDATFQRFLGALSAEGKMTVGNRVVGNSNTAAKLADQADLRRHPAVKAALAAGNMKFGDALKALAAGGLEARSARLSEASRGELAKILTADPVTLEEFLNAASQRGRRSSANGDYLARALGGLVGRTVSSP